MAQAGVAYVDFQARFRNLNAQVAARMRGLSSQMATAMTPQRGMIRRISSGYATGFRRVGEGAGRALRLGLLGAGVAAGALIKTSVDAASDLEESANKVNVVFGDAAGEINAFSKNAAKDLGISRQQALEATSTFGNLFVAMKIGRPQAADMSQGMVQLASDLASFNNANPEDVLVALRSGLTGEIEPLRKFGVNLTQARIEAKALEMGLISNKGELDAGSKAQAAYALIMEDTTTAQGDFARTSDGLANRQRTLSATWKDMQARIGKALLPAISSLVGFMGDKLPGAIDTVSGAFKTVWEAIRPVADAIVGFFKDNPQSLFAALGVVIVSVVVPAVWSLAGGVLALFSPFVLITGAIAVLAAGLVWAYNRFPVFQTIVQSVMKAVVTAFNWVRTVAMVVWRAVVAVIQWAWSNVIQPLWAAIAAFVRTVLVPVFQVIVKVFSAVWNAVVAVVRWAWNNIIQPLWTAIAAFVRTVLVPVFQVIAKVFSAVWNAVVAVIRWAWNNIIKPLWTAIKFYIDTVLLPVFRVISTVMQTVWNAVVAVIRWAWNNIIKPLWTAIKLYIDTVLLPVFRVISTVMRAVWDGVVAVIRWAWNTIIKPLWTAIKTFINTILLPVFDKIWTTMQTVWNAVSSIISTAWNKGIKPIWDGIRDFITKKFLPAFGKIRDTLSKVWTKIKDTAGSAWDGIMGVIRGAINVGIKIINKLIDGINLVVGIIPGVDKIKHIPELGANAGKPRGGGGGSSQRLARGGTVPVELSKLGPFMTNGPQAIVGEGNRRYPEYVIPTDPKYRNRALGLASAMASDLGMPMPQMAFGGILGDAWDKIKGVASGIREGAAALAFGPANAAAKLLIKQVPVPFVRKTMDNIRQKLYDWIRGKEIEHGVSGPGGGSPGGPGGTSGGVQRWHGVAVQALRMAGQSPAWVNDLLRQMQHESGGNPRAINLWDSNARRGTPSKGLMQTIDSTFNAYAGHLRGRGIYDPLANIYAAVRYTLSRYGSLGAWRQRGFKGYARGGVLPFVHANSFDQGGVLKPGWNVVRNDTGNLEQLSPDGRGRAAVEIAEANFYEGVDYDLFLRKTGFMAQAGRI